MNPDPQYCLWVGYGMWFDLLFSGVLHLLYLHISKWLFSAAKNTKYNKLTFFWTVFLAVRIKKWIGRYWYSTLKIRGILNLSAFSVLLLFKGSLPRDIRLQVFFSLISFPQRPLSIPLGRFQNCMKTRRDICNFVSLLPAINYCQCHWLIYRR